MREQIHCNQRSSTEFPGVPSAFKFEEVKTCQLNKETQPLCTTVCIMWYLKLFLITAIMYMLIHKFLYTFYLLKEMD